MVSETKTYSNKTMTGKRFSISLQRADGWCKSAADDNRSALEYLMMNYDGHARYSV